MQSSLYVLTRQLRIARENLLGSVAVCDTADNPTHGNARSLNARITMMNGRVYAYAIQPV